MTDPDDRRGLARWWGPAVASLVPWAAFLLPLYVGGLVRGTEWELEPQFTVVLPGYLLLISLPSLLPLTVAPPGRLRLAVLVLLTGVALYASWFVMTSESSTAGLAVFLVPQVAIPLALVLAVGLRVHRTLKG
jgi:hypothetical protein